MRVRNNYADLRSVMKGHLIPHTLTPSGAQCGDTIVSTHTCSRFSCGCWQRFQGNTVPICNSCTKRLGSPGEIHDRTTDCHQVHWTWMQPQVPDLITRYWQTSGRLVQELNVCTVHALHVYTLPHDKKANVNELDLKWSKGFAKFW